MVSLIAIADWRRPLAHATYRRECAQKGAPFFSGEPPFNRISESAANCGCLEDFWAVSPAKRSLCGLAGPLADLHLIWLLGCLQFARQINRYDKMGAGYVVVTANVQLVNRLQLELVWEINWQMIRRKLVVVIINIKRVLKQKNSKI